VPAAGQNATAGRLNYEMPILNVMGRECGTFVELQQTLGQLGITKDVLLRLNFRNSGKPLEEAHEEISQYFREVEEADSQVAEASSAPTKSANMNEIPKAEGKPSAMEDGSSAPIPMEDVKATAALEVTDPAPPVQSSQNTLQSASASTAPSPQILGPNERPITIFAPPTSSTPQASSVPHNPADYDLSVDQAKKYQAHLQESSRNKRLPSDVEIAEQERLKAEKLSAVRDVRIRVRLPDQSQVEVNMDRTQTGRDVYSFVRDMLEFPKDEFVLRYPGAKGTMTTLTDGPQKLVSDLSFQGRVLVTFAWGDKVSIDKKRAPTLKKEWRDKAQNLRVDTMPGSQPDEETKPAENLASKSAGKQKMSDVDKESKLKSLLGKTLFKKK
jgi:tether containing UBX domain for GLUT4